MTVLWREEIAVAAGKRCGKRRERQQRDDSLPTKAEFAMLKSIV